MKNIFEDSYAARKTYREIKILRKLTRIEANLFTTKLIDIILPTAFDEDLKDSEGNYNINFIPKNIFEERKSISYFSNEVKAIEKSAKPNFKKFNHIFVVLELVESDIKKLVSTEH